ncbi:hypothetical protein BHM03_00034416 [Ensete ventricosum]|nr:hypothetical protein BHM03_00034416 [Ensete ventricosum]
MAVVAMALCWEGEQSTERRWAVALRGALGREIRGSILATMVAAILSLLRTLLCAWGQMRAAVATGCRDQMQEIEAGAETVVCYRWGREGAAARWSL